MTSEPDDAGRLRGRVALVTGAGRGLGRAHALRLASLGAAVVVNDPGGSVDGAAEPGSDPAGDVAREIEAIGGRAVADRTPVGDWAAARTIVGTALQRFGALDVLVNNAGILRPRAIVDMAAADWDDVLRVHLDGTFSLIRAAATHWRDRAEAGDVVRARVVNTTSASGLFGAGQANYAAAKAATVALTQIAAAELASYGVTVNAVAPVALTRMSLGLATEDHPPDPVAQLVGWLCSDAAADVTGEVFNVAGGHVSVVERPHTGPGIDRAGSWSLAELDLAVPGLLARASAHPDLFGYRPDEARPESLTGIALRQNQQVGRRTGAEDG